MKTLLYILLVLSVFVSSCTEMRCWNYVYGKKEPFYYPHKDTFKVGDTLWINFSLPKTIVSDCGSITIDKDSIKVGLPIRINSHYDLEIQHWCDNMEKVKFTKGCLYNNCLFNFIYNKEIERYEAEFYYILQDTGRAFFGDPTGKVIANIKDSGYKYKGWFGISYRTNDLDYWTTFKETNTGGFYVYVKP